jgi:signal transduction histidine kinase
LWQTIWFRALGVAALAGLLWGLYRWRLGLHARRMQVSTEARLAERERIAQNLHDMLLQGALARTWKFQVLIAQLSHGELPHVGVGK